MAGATGRPATHAATRGSNPLAASIPRGRRFGSSGQSVIRPAGKSAAGVIRIRVFTSAEFLASGSTSSDALAMLAAACTRRANRFCKRSSASLNSRSLLGRNSNNSRRRMRNTVCPADPRYPKNHRPPASLARAAIGANRIAAGGPSGHSTPSRPRHTEPEDSVANWPPAPIGRLGCGPRERRMALASVPWSPVH